MFAIVSPYGLAKKNKKVTFKLYIIPPAAGVAYIDYRFYQTVYVFRIHASNIENYDKVKKCHIFRKCSFWCRVLSVFPVNIVKG